MVGSHDMSKNSDTKTLIVNRPLTTNVAAGQCIAYGLSMETTTVKAQYEVIQRPFHYFGAHNKKACGGHYFYFVSMYYLKDSDIARTIQGSLEGVVGTKGSSFITSC